MVCLMRCGVLIVLGSVLLACTAPTTIDAPPPELTTLELSEAEQPEIDADHTAEMTISAQAATELKRSDTPRAFLPGLAKSDTERGESVDKAVAGDQNEVTEASTGQKEVPFEDELVRQRKRIQLGLEPEQHEQNPVDNMINLGF